MTGGWDCACGATGLSGVRCASCGRTAPWYVPPPRTMEPDPPPPRRLSRRGLVALLLLPLVAVGAVVGAEVTDRRAAARAAARAATIAELVTFVERERGRPFRTRPDVSLLGEREFRFVVLRDREPEPLADQPIGSTLRALGLETRGIPADDGPFGRYDSETRRVYVRGTELTPSVKYVVVNELTHAWQDQHLRLPALGRQRETEAERGFEALVEGDAERVARAWLKTQPPADEVAVLVEQDRLAGGPDLPAPVAAARALNRFPYEHGPGFVDALHRRGGNAAVDAAFERPPTTSEQVMRVDRYERREAPAKVGYPPAPGAEQDTGTFGEYGLMVLVARGAPDHLAMTSVVGWNGDSYVTWSDGARLCLDVRVRMDSRRWRDALLRALRERARPDDEFTPRGADGLDARFCE